MTGQLYKTRIPWNDVSCPSTYCHRAKAAKNSTERYVTPALCLHIKNSKHECDTYFNKIHLVVHVILSVSNFSIVLVMEDGSHFES